MTRPPVAGPAWSDEQASADGRVVPPALPAIVDGVVAHERRGPVAHRFAHRAHLWLIDLDDVPRYPRWLRPVTTFRARDHLGGTEPGASSSIKTNVVRFLAGRGIDLAGGRIIMLANARVFGHVFDPLVVHWCFDREGALRCVIADVHNTYGERHAYVVEPDAAGRADTAKQLYVSPFNDVSGRYELRFTLDEQTVAVQVRLVRDGVAAFDASFTGAPRPATAPEVVRRTLRRPFMPQRVSALIRLHGVWLWARRLPVVERPRRTQRTGRIT